MVGKMTTPSYIKNYIASSSKYPSNLTIVLLSSEFAVGQTNGRIFYNVTYPILFVKISVNIRSFSIARRRYLGTNSGAFSLQLFTNWSTRFKDRLIILQYGIPTYVEKVVTIRVLTSTLSTPTQYFICIVYSSYSYRILHVRCTQGLWK